MVTNCNHLIANPADPIIKPNPIMPRLPGSNSGLEYPSPSPNRLSQTGPYTYDFTYRNLGTSRIVDTGYGFFRPTMGVLEMCQSITQAVPLSVRKASEKGNMGDAAMASLLQLPHVDQVLI